MTCHDGTEAMAVSSSFCRQLSEIVGDDLPSFLSLRSASGGMRAVTGYLKWLSMACVLRPRVQTTYPDKGEHCPGRGFESVVCPLEETRVESWRATCPMGECCAGLPRGRLGVIPTTTSCSSPPLSIMPLLVGSPRWWRPSLFSSVFHFSLFSHSLLFLPLFHFPLISHLFSFLPILSSFLTRTMRYQTQHLYYGYHSILISFSKKMGKPSFICMFWAFGFCLWHLGLCFIHLNCNLRLGLLGLTCY